MKRVLSKRKRKEKENRMTDRRIEEKEDGEDG